MEEVRCQRCGATWLSPAGIDVAVRQEVATLIRSADTIAAIRRLREATGLGLRDAKGVPQHVTREPRKCHWYGVALPAKGTVSCTKCRSLNYDW
jgi:hypothetical protein